MITEDERHKDLSDAADGEAVQWRDGVLPVSPRFDDTYFSDVDGRAETREVFLGGNGLPERWRGGGTFTIAELGFGTGLNFLETVHCWSEFAPDGAALEFVSFELFPLAAKDVERALSAWSEIGGLGDQWLADWPGDGACFKATRGAVSLAVHFGDARQTVCDTSFRADAWFLDGFSPAQNPELWHADLMAAVFCRTALGGTFATYTAAGWVRRNLHAAGFNVEKVAGFGRKRERLQGIRDSPDGIAGDTAL